MHGNEHLEVGMGTARGITNVEEEGAHCQERWVENRDRMLDESDLYMRPPGPSALPG